MRGWKSSWPRKIANGIFQNCLLYQNPVAPARNSFLIFRNSIYNKFKDNKEPKSIPA